MTNHNHNPKRILIVEDNQFLMEGLAIIINDEPDMEVVGMATSRTKGLDLALKEMPDLVLLDIGLGDENGIDIIPDLVNKTDAKVLIMTGMPVLELYEDALSKGARGILLKEENTSAILLEAIKRVVEGKIWLSESIRHCISIHHPE